MPSVGRQPIGGTLGRWHKRFDRAFHRPAVVCEKTAVVPRVTRGTRRSPYAFRGRQNPEMPSGHCKERIASVAAYGPSAAATAGKVQARCNWSGGCLQNERSNIFPILQACTSTALLRVRVFQTFVRSKIG